MRPHWSDYRTIRVFECVSHDGVTNPMKSISWRPASPFVPPHHCSSRTGRTFTRCAPCRHWLANRCPVHSTTPGPGSVSSSTPTPGERFVSRREEPQVPWTRPCCGKSMVVLPWSSELYVPFTPACPYVPVADEAKFIIVPQTMRLDCTAVIQIGRPLRKDNNNDKPVYGLYIVNMINVGRGDDGFDMRKIVFRMARPS
jgi:hypothetical protein